MVSAAISLTDALESIAQEYAKAGGGPVRFNFAGSNTLARQLVNGAPADVFISADEAQMDVAAQAGAIDPATRVDLLSNHLAVVARTVRDAKDLAGPAVRHIALADPAAVPAGVYARRYLEATGLWSKVSDRIVPVANVRAALAAVVNGSVDAAIVYESDTLTAPSLTAIAVGAMANGVDLPRIVYPAAIVSRSTNRAAADRFLTFLRGPQASAVFARYRFIPLSSAAR
jgi:molybdate transport system substrate-binding protein